MKLWLQRMMTIATIEWLHLRRDRTTLSLIFLMPAIQMALFGYAIHPLPQHVPLAIARPHAGGNVEKMIDGLGIFTIIADGLPQGEAAKRVHAGTAVIGIDWPPPPNTSSPDAPETSAAITITVDDSDPALSTPALSALEAGYLRMRATDTLSPTPPIAIVRLYNPENRHDWAITPALTGVIVMISMLLLGALTLVREREHGTWEALLAMPVSASQALLGKLTPYMFLGLVQAAIVIAAGHLLFDLPIRGSLFALMLFTALHALAHLCIGFALSAAAKSQVQAIQGAVFFYLPSMLLSGFLYPFANMPFWAQGLGEILPLTHYVRAARGVLLQGYGMHAVLHEALPVALFTLAASTLALRLYRKRL